MAGVLPALEQAGADHVLSDGAAVHGLALAPRGDGYRHLPGDLRLSPSCGNQRREMRLAEGKGPVPLLPKERTHQERKLGKDTKVAS